MQRNTLQQFILFIITSIIIFHSGKFVIAINDLDSFTDFAIVMVFFLTIILFINYLLRLASAFLKMARE
mgnify:FL=1|jgi:hypothetical protein